MKFNLLDKILKSTIKLALPQDCPDELIEYHYIKIRENITNNSKKLKNKVKSIINSKNKKQWPAE